MFLSGEVSWMCQSGDFQVNLIFESDKATICAKSHTWQGFCFDQGLLRWQPFLWQCDLSKRGLYRKEMYEIILRKVFSVQQDQTGLDRSARSTLDFGAKGLKVSRFRGLEVSRSQCLNVSRS